MRAEYTNLPTFNLAQRKSSLEIRILEKKKQKNSLGSFLNGMGLEVRFKFVFGQWHPTIGFRKIYIRGSTYCLEIFVA